MKKDYKGKEREVALDNLNSILEDSSKGILKSIDFKNIMMGSVSNFVKKSILNQEQKSSVSARQCNNKTPSSVERHKLRGSATVVGPRSSCAHPGGGAATRAGRAEPDQQDAAQRRPGGEGP